MCNGGYSLWGDMKFIHKLLITIGVVGTIAATTLGWVKVPGRMNVVEKRVTEGEKKQQKTKSELDMFIMEQRTIQQSNADLRKSMKDYIDAKTEK